MLQHTGHVTEDKTQDTGLHTSYQTTQRSCDPSRHTVTLNLRYRTLDKALDKSC